MSGVDAKEIAKSSKETETKVSDEVPTGGLGLENVVTVDSGPEIGTRQRKLTDKGREYQLSLKEGIRKSAYQRLAKEVQYANSSLGHLGAIDLENLRDKLDELKDEFNQCHSAYDALLETESEKLLA